MGTYYNPPGDIRTIGRRLTGGDYTQLHAQLRPDEVVIGVFENTVQSGTFDPSTGQTETSPPHRFLVAQWIKSQHDIDELIATVEFYAVERAKAEQGSS